MDLADEIPDIFASKNSVTENLNFYNSRKFRKEFVGNLMRLVRFRLQICYSSKNMI